MKLDVHLHYNKSTMRNDRSTRHKIRTFCASPSPEVELCNDSLNLPVDLLSHIMLFMSYTDLCTMSQTSRFFNKLSCDRRFWTYHNERLIANLEQHGLHLGSREEGGKEFCSVLHTHFDTLKIVSYLLKRLKYFSRGIPIDTEDTILTELLSPSRDTSTSIQIESRPISPLLLCNIVEVLFQTRLCVLSPWRSVPLEERVKKELEDIQWNERRKWSLCGKVLGLYLFIRHGFYRGEKIHIHIHLGGDYPFSPPDVYMISKDLYHPFVSSLGRVHLTILENKGWDYRKYNLSNVILEIERLFTDQTFLTCHFTL
eukprot:TRINITY_DN3018_c0_g1_i5.p1 TRINITY_DN3018_c0_g1~~TRINITY_DN3018_c0_g1_i5.p1  ORF type:complete len:313 (-),score=26.34 TRINITY_DN3018_c0_g1_i5:70-1008(-)